MVAAALKRYRTIGLIALWSTFVLGALFALALTAQNSVQFGRLQPWILAASALGVVVFSVLLARKILQLVRAYRGHVPGSRLTARTVFVFGLLVVLPLLTMYLFSLEFLNRGIDSWFRVEVKQGLNDALVLSRAALDLRMREHGERTEDFARSLESASLVDAVAALDEERRASGATEIVLYGQHERVIAASAASGPDDGLPARPPRDLVRQVSEGSTFVSLEPIAEGRYIIRTAAPIAPLAGSSGARGRGEGRYVLAVYEVPRQLAALADAVQRSYSQYGDLAALREPLKYSFRLTLTLVLLVTMLAAIYGAIFSAEILFKPVQDLMAGTRAVAKGDLGTRVPLSSRDEMGFLVHSFNDMTKRLRRAREEAERSRQAVERERQRLAIILARLSAGVIAIDRDLRLRIANESAGEILGLDLDLHAGRSLEELAQGHERLRQFVEELRRRFSAGHEEWREQIELTAGAGAPRVLVCACVPLVGEEPATPLAAVGAAPAAATSAAAAPVGVASIAPAIEPAPESARSYVIVFDEITALLQAQREAAWGEVARRLAHEIKNPLTPIQLSAERMRRKLLAGLSEPDAQVLDRATHTIVQQVEAMKQMVNAFSEYARAPALQIARIDLNALVVEATDLYRAQAGAVVIRTSLAPGLEFVEADRGRMRQILNNLLTNSLEALEGTAEPQIEVATALRLDEPTAVLTVTDNGPGIPKELLARVFEPYVTSKPRGTGLGLAIVRRIVEEHGGRIDAENRPEGGTRVRVMLPLRNRSRSSLAGGRERSSELRRERA